MAPKLFHFSKVQISTGECLQPSGSHHLSEEVEALLEQTRPGNCIARRDSVFVSEDEECAKHGLPFDEGFLHAVEPVGPIERRDNAWLGILQLRHSKRLGMRISGNNQYPELTNEEIAHNYWTGAKSKNPNWEIAATKVMVKECLDNELRQLNRNIPLPF